MDYSKKAALVFCTVNVDDVSLYRQLCLACRRILPEILRVWTATSQAVSFGRRRHRCVCSISELWKASHFPPRLRSSDVSPVLFRLFPPAPCFELAVLLDAGAASGKLAFGDASDDDNGGDGNSDDGCAGDAAFFCGTVRPGRYPHLIRRRISSSLKPSATRGVASWTA